MSNLDFYRDLDERGLIHQVSATKLDEVLSSRRVTAYAGFDPTADSLHVGSLVPLMTLMRFQLAGHRPIALLGGGTGLIGDPSGKEDERSLLMREQLEHNVAGIRAQVARFIDLDDEDKGVLVNNADWLCKLNYIEFLRDIGKHFSVNQMIVRDSVRMRLETRDHGLSYTEFSYMLLQAYDYLALHDRFGCTLQMGGSDQWGNICSGADLVRRLRGVETHALTTPLMTRSDGKKFGKSEAGNVWLSAERTSPYQFYQFWLNTDDADVVRYLKTFTLLSLDEIRDAEQAVSTSPQERAAQRLLAEQVTRLIHGADALSRAQRATSVLFDKHADYRTLSAQELGEAFQGAPTSTIPRVVLGTPDANLIAVVSSAEVGLYPSRGRARKDWANGPVSVNNASINDPEYGLSVDDLLPGGFIILRKGKKHYHVLRVID